MSFKKNRINYNKKRYFSVVNKIHLNKKYGRKLKVDSLRIKIERSFQIFNCLKKNIKK